MSTEADPLFHVARTVTVALSVEVDLDAWCTEYGHDDTASAYAQALQDLGDTDYYLQQIKWRYLARVAAVTVTAPAS